MNPLRTLGHWLDIRPGEVRPAGLSVLGAFFVMAFITLARALREAVYLTTFEVRTLPYITAAFVILSFPAVGLFTRLLSCRPPRRVMWLVVLILIGGLLGIWPFASGGEGTSFRVTVVVFYLWTGLGGLLVTSGFWIITSECFAVRGAKRLFGLIGAGGTAGVMVMGISLNWITEQLALIWLLPVLGGLLALFLVVQLFLPPPQSTREGCEEEAASDRTSLPETLGLVWRSPHLRTIAIVVFVAAAASAIVDYQFKELARLRIDNDAELAGFFGAFYGWTGGIALVIQLIGAARIMALAGIGSGLSILALCLLLGSGGLLILPALALATLVRGADNALRKAVHRPLIEFLYVPIPTMLRRKTKTFIDSIVDSAAEGFGAAVVLLWVTLPGLPSRYLSVFAVLLAGCFLYFCRTMGREYFKTIVAQLKQGDAVAEGMLDEARGRERDLLGATWTQMDARSLITEGGLRAEDIEKIVAPEGDGAKERVRPDVLEPLTSAHAETVLQASGEATEGGAEDLHALVRLLARDAVSRRATEVLVGMGEAAVPVLAQFIRDESGDFVIRRRIPRVLAEAGGTNADDALLDSLVAVRFEIRYRAAIALIKRRKHGLPESNRGRAARIWSAIRKEISRGRPVWELQKLLDGFESTEDDLVVARVGIRGELSLEHTFRMLSLVLDPEPVVAAFHGIVLEDENLKSYALEYLEQALPADVRRRLWLFIGDVSEYQKEKARRPMGEVVNDLMTTRATLFAGEKEREALRKMLEDKE